MLCLRLLGTVSGASAAALVDARRVELAAHDGVLDSNILHAASAHEDDGVFLKVVAFARDVCGYFLPVGETYAGDLTNSGVRLAGGLGGYLRADAALEGGRIESGAVLESIEATGKSHDLRFGRLGFASLLGKLIDCGHYLK